MVPVEYVLQLTMEISNMLIDVGIMMVRGMKGSYENYCIIGGWWRMNVGWWTKVWNTYGWMDGNVVKINFGTYLEGWWSCEGEVDFKFGDLDRVDMDFGI